EALELVQQAYQTALDVLRAHADDLERVAQRLLEVETIEGDELDELISPPRPLPVREPVSRREPQTAHHPSVREQRRRGRALRLGRALGAVAAVTRDSFGTLRAT